MVMTVDTRNGWLAIIAMVAMAFVVCTSAVGIVVLAVVHDGALSSQAMDSFKQVLIGSGFFGTVLGSIEGITRAQTAKAAISSGASVQGSPVSVTQDTPTQGASQAAGAGAIAGDVQEGESVPATAQDGAA